MKDFNSLLNFNFVRILNYFGYRQQYKTDTVACFSGNSTHTYYLFMEENRDNLSLFSSKSCSLLDKELLFFQLASMENLTVATGLIQAISSFQPVDASPSFNRTITLPMVAAIACELGTLIINESNTFAQLDVFQKRIFTSRSLSLSVPLCLYENRKFISFVNAVHWKGNERSYLNESTEGIYTSLLLPSATKAFLSSHPFAWQVAPQHVTVSEHFFILIHEQAGSKTFSAVKKLLSAEKFSNEVIPLSDSFSNYAFACNYFQYSCYLLNPSIQFSLQAHNDYLEAHFSGDDELMDMLTLLVQEYNSKSSQVFYSGLKNEYSFHSLIDKYFLLEKFSHRKGKQYYFSLRIPRKAVWCVLFLTMLNKLVYPESGIEFIHLE